MKVIFLDIDGVLVTPKSKWNLRAGRFDFVPELVSNLRKIVTQTEALIVLSSTWRFNGFKEVQKLFEEHGLFLHDHTALEDQHNRGQHIQLWLDAHKDVTNFVAIDDDVTIRMLGDRAVLVNLDDGLDDEATEQAIMKLTKVIHGT